MSRLKVLAAAVLLGLPLAACDGGTPPPAVGDIEGQVVVEGTGIDGVSVTLSTGAATTTSGGGMYAFSDIEAGTYTVSIAGFPGDASFPATTAEVTIADDGQTVTRNFTGQYIRTSALEGMVTVEGKGLPGIPVTITGQQEGQTQTDANGQYRFTGLRAGNYTIEISGFDPTDVAFSNTTNAVTVTVSLQGMGEDVERNTDTGGQYTFSNLRAGEYQLAITGYDPREHGFETTSATVRVEHGKTANVPFEGYLLRTASIMGQVSVEGEGIPNVTVTLLGEGENQTRETNQSGQYAFSDLPAGNFQVAITGYDTDDYSFETTSKNVALALGETATVPFEGILLRTSGISGRVSVEGDGLDSVTVTLSGDDLDEDVSDMTNASGQYQFAGLAEGDYTVEISGYDDVSYIFKTTSMDVELGDDDTQIVNFMGDHARTASVTVRMFVDELANNNLRDEGEHAFPSAEMLAGVDPQNIPALLEGLKSVVSLTGPGVHDPNEGAVMLDGSFVFAGLKAGDYQLMVNDIPATLLAAMPALQDFAYGGPAAGYPIALAVGDEESQDVPIDITHTTVNFGVTLKHGDKTGAALEGATVTLYRDAAGTLKIDDAMTGATGMAAIRIARAGTTGNTVYAAVAAPAVNYATSGAMQPVTWNPQYPATMATNGADIVNTMADFSFSGATITTDFGGGKALGGWKVGVTSGTEAVMDAPTELDSMGMAKFSESVAAGDLPKMYKIEMAGWKDQANDSTGDGGERYTSTTLMHEHDGLSVAGTSTNAGTLEVTYTTQTLRVYVHQENDQVMGFTGNVLGGDKRMGGIIDVDIAHIASNGRSVGFEATDSVRPSAGGGVYTFRNVPAGANVIVTADEFPTLGKDKDGGDIANTAHLLKKNGHSDEIAAYADVEANGIMYGAFGAHGGFHHTVELCPLMSRDADQRHGECGTFAFVETFAVDGQAWKYVVAKTSDDFAANASKTGMKGLTVNMTPVAGENLAGEDNSFTAKSAGSLKFDFGRMPSGVYEVTAPTGWTAQRGPLDAPTNDLAARLNPLDSALNIDVTPATGYVYGSVTDSDNRRMAGVTVNVNGRSVTTDSNGRYVAEGFGKENCLVGTRTVRNTICVTTEHEGSEKTTNAVSFAANTPKRVNVRIADAQEVTTISGRVTHSDGGAGVGGVLVWVDGRAPLNKNAKINKSKTNNAYKTGGDGSFNVRIPAKAGGASAIVRVEKDGMFFSPDQHTVGAVAGASISGISFTGFDNGTIHGRVVDGRNNAISGVIVTATQVSPGTATDADTTGVTGTYSLSVRYGQYDVTAAKAGYTITGANGINVPNDGKAIDDLVATQNAGYSKLSSLSLSGVSRLCHMGADCTKPANRGFESGQASYTATVGNSLSMTTVTATPGGGARVTEIYPGDADATASGHQVALDDARVTTIEIRVVSSDNSDTTEYDVEITRLDETTTITGTVTDAVSGDAIAGVTITPAGGNLLNGGTMGTVSTNSKGEYTVIMESGSGSTTLTPSKTSYTFEPGSRAVQLNAGTVTGADFTGSAYATISGRVMVDESAMEGVTVTGTSTGGGTPGSDVTDRRGNFSFKVAAGTITITAEKAGYSSEPTRVFARAGESRSVGNVELTGNRQPIFHRFTRGRSATGAFHYHASSFVTFSPGPGGKTDRYNIQECTVEDCSVEANWTDARVVPEEDFDAEINLYRMNDFNVNDARYDGAFQLRIMAEDSDGTDIMASHPVTVDAIDPTATEVAARRLTDPQPDSLVVSYVSLNNARTQTRIAIGFTGSDGTVTWELIDDEVTRSELTTAPARRGHPPDPVALTYSYGVYLDNNLLNTKTAAELEGTFMIRVETRQRSTDDWTPSKVVTVLKKSTSSG